MPCCCQHSQVLAFLSGSIVCLPLFFSLSHADHPPSCFSASLNVACHPPASMPACLHPTSLRVCCLSPLLSAALLQNSLERNSEHFYLSRNGPERNCEVPECYSLQQNGSEQKSEPFLSSAEWLGTEFRAFSVPRNRRNSDGMNQNFRLFRIPRNNFFLGNWQP